MRSAVNRTLIPVVMLLFSATGWAQDAPGWEIFGGYSFMRSDIREYYRQTPIIYNFRGKYGNLQGFEVSITENKNRLLGGTFDLSANFRSPLIGGVQNRQRMYTLMYGPRVSTRFLFAKPFVHALLGAAYGSVKVTPTGPHDSDLSFALAVGGGVDIKLGERFSIRAVQADYFRSNNAMVPRPHAYRASAGIVWNLGKRQ